MITLQYATFHIVLCGAGATGSQLLPFLTQLLNNTKENMLTIIDGDFIEIKNLKNQKFLPNDIGKNKAHVLYERYHKLYPHLDLAYRDTYIYKEQELISLLKGEQYAYFSKIPILVGCVDNNATRKLFKKVYDSFNGKLIYLDSGNGTNERVGQTIVAYKDNVYKTPCVADIFSEILQEKQTISNATSCGAVTDKYPQNIATNVMAANILFSHLTNILMFEEVNPSITFFDAANISTSLKVFNIEDYITKSKDSDIF